MEPSRLFTNPTHRHRRSRRPSPAVNARELHVGTMQRRAWFHGLHGPRTDTIQYRRPLLFSFFVFSTSAWLGYPNNLARMRHPTTKHPIHSGWARPAVRGKGAGWAIIFATTHDNPSPPQSTRPSQISHALLRAVSDECCAAELWISWPSSGERRKNSSTGVQMPLPSLPFPQAFTGLDATVN